MTVAEDRTVTNPFDHWIPDQEKPFLENSTLSPQIIDLLSNREFMLRGDLGKTALLISESSNNLPIDIQLQRIFNNDSFLFPRKSIVLMAVAGVTAWGLPLAITIRRARTKKLSDPYPNWTHFFQSIQSSIEGSRAFSEILKAFRIQEKISLTEAIELEIVEKYKQIQEVEAIYTQKYRKELQVTILLKTNKYNDNLMDQLLDLEYELQEKHKESYLVMSYIPVGSNATRSDFHPKSKLIFQQ